MKTAGGIVALLAILSGCESTKTEKRPTVPAKPNRVERVPPPRLPPLELLNFRGGEVYRGGATLLIALRTELPLESLGVRFSGDGGKSWSEAPLKHLVPVQGGLMWGPLPSRTGERYRLRVSGMGAQASSKSDWAIDADPPIAVLTGPRGAVNRYPVVLEAKVKPSLAPILERVLYVTHDGGRNWSRYKAFPGDQITFTAERPGWHGLFLAARSGAGLGGESPEQGTTPQLKLFAVSGALPMLAETQLTAALPSVVKGGDKVPLAWRASTRGKVRLHLFADGEERVIREGLPPQGTIDWIVPKRNAAYCELRLSVTDGAGTRWSPPGRIFRMDSRPPRVTGGGVKDD